MPAERGPKITQQVTSSRPISVVSTSPMLGTATQVGTGIKCWTRHYKAKSMQSVPKRFSLAGLVSNRVGFRRVTASAM